ncbi:ATP-dependent DNA helicase RecQ [Pseudomonas sp. 5P_3.1_Bac2]|uniref:RecQ family ATP-dependent DNA helicase n=1 Tax=Pseudomonas sp. 5P_3.1_Bac2 TaxID=2971617 RepID=UPI0021C72B2D|nr:RecQ family ATP-dependent DNA helicase [Pseudomonas sp. 5P_3.1_Bac2]MCU1718535.1 RecQ family ATP-dependent DNA helicase [Pseudomonas sp. 5P_3.1_Bac2]
MLSTLQTVFGFSQLRPGQDAVVSALLAGRSAAAIFPTGSGKSLCYQLPALHLPHLTLVVSPLLALMQDQLAFLHRLGISAGSIDSAQSREQANATMAKARAGELKILMISVERLKNERFRHFLSQVAISMLVVDEAHCISAWGHNFRPDYLKLPDYQRQFNIPQVLLLTATATAPVIADMQRQFAIAEADVVRTGFYRPNLNLLVAPISGNDRQQYVAQWLQGKAGQASIVYVTQQQTAEQLAAYLSQQGVPAQAYHAGLPSEQRERIQRQFMAGASRCIVATIAFGMGIDKADIRNVLHFDLPKSIENYSQEIGRAGRDGQPADCVVLANRDSLSLLENFVYGDTPELSAIAEVLSALRQGSSHGQWELLLNALSEQSNIRPLPLKTLLVQLELRGIIRPLYAYFAEYRFKFSVEPQLIVQRMPGERRQFTEALFASAQRARTWLTMDFEQLWQQHQGERGRAIKALEYFQEQGWIELQSKQMTEVYSVLKADFDPEQLSAELHDYFSQQERSEITRIHAMLELFASRQCLSQRLAGYFGDTSAPQHCGHCSVCRGQLAELPQPPALAALDAGQVQKLAGAFVAVHQQRLGHAPSSTCLTRFLCGISMPLLLRLKARQLPGFAALADYPYAEVRACLDAA